MLLLSVLSYDNKLVRLVVFKDFFICTLETPHLSPKFSSPIYFAIHK